MSKRKGKIYVVHYCPKCNNCWIDEDKTKCKDRPPKWKLCRECCEKLGIDFNKQKTTGKGNKKTS